MAEHLVTLLLSADDSLGDPSGWDWATKMGADTVQILAHGALPSLVVAPVSFEETALTLEVDVSDLQLEQEPAESVESPAAFEAPVFTEADVDLEESTEAGLVPDDSAVSEPLPDAELTAASWDVYAQQAGAELELVLEPAADDAPGEQPAEADGLSFEDNPAPELSVDDSPTFELSDEAEHVMSFASMLDQVEDGAQDDEALSASETAGEDAVESISLAFSDISSLSDAVDSEAAPQAADLEVVDADAPVEAVPAAGFFDLDAAEPEVGTSSWQQAAAGVSTENPWSTVAETASDSPQETEPVEFGATDGWVEADVATVTYDADLSDFQPDVAGTDGGQDEAGSAGAPAVPDEQIAAEESSVAGEQPEEAGESSHGYDDGLSVTGQLSQLSQLDTVTTATPDDSLTDQERYERAYKLFSELWTMTVVAADPYARMLLNSFTELTPAAMLDRLTGFLDVDGKTPSPVDPAVSADLAARIRQLDPNTFASA